MPLRRRPAPVTTPAPSYVRVELGSYAAVLAQLAADAGPGHTRQSVIRGLIHLASDDGSLLERAVATQAPLDEERAPGVQRGYTVEDYQRALDEAGSVAGAARRLGVHLSTAQEMARAHGLVARKRRRA